MHLTFLFPRSNAFSTFATFYVVILHEIFICQREIQLKMRTEYRHDSIRNEMHGGFIPTIEQIERYYLLPTVNCVVLLLHGTFSPTLTPTTHIPFPSRSALLL